MCCSWIWICSTNNDRKLRPAFWTVPPIRWVARYYGQTLIGAVRRGRRDDGGVADLVDPLSFPELAGAALSQAFAFLFGRLSRVLDNRGKAAEEPERVETPEVMQGRLDPLAARPNVVEENLAELRELAGTLGVYERNPERLDGHDDNLRKDLARLRALLEKVYGQRITFRGETREATGVVVEQRMDAVAGEVTGVRGGRVSQARVSQDIKRVGRDSSVIGVHADDVG